MINKVILIGNVTRDVELRYTSKGTAVAEVGLAMNRRYKGNDGNVQEDTVYVDVTLWGKTAKIGAECLEKGRQIYVEGRLEQDQWEDRQTGQKRSRLKVVVEELKFFGGAPQKKPRAEPQPPRAQPQPKPHQRKVPVTVYELLDSSDEEQYYTLGVFETLEDVESALGDEPWDLAYKTDEYVQLEVRKRWIGSLSAGKTVWKRRWQMSCIEATDECEWQLL